MEPYANEIRPMEYAEAFAAVKRGKNLFLLLVLLAIGVQLGAFILVEFVGVLGPRKAVETQVSPLAPTTAPAAMAGGELTATDKACQTWRTVLSWALPAAKFLAPTACMLLVLMLLFAVKLSLIGRLGGIAGLVGALLWSVILLALVAPWQQIFKGSLACGAMSSYGEMVNWVNKFHAPADGKASGMTDQIFFYARFIAYPAMALLVWLVVQVKFARGCGRMNIPPSVRMNQPTPQV